MISTVGTIYSHSWTVTAYGARHVTDGQTERKERGYMLSLIHILGPANFAGLTPYAAAAAISTKRWIK